MRKYIIILLSPLWWIVSALIPKKKSYIAINAFPDFDDTVYAIAKEATVNGNKAIILTIDKKAIAPEWIKAFNVQIAYRYSLKGLWLYHRSEHVFITHGLFSFWKTSGAQKIINIWHGMPIKNIGCLDNKNILDLPKFDFTIAYNNMFKTIIAKSFNISESDVLLSGHPRVDGLFINPSLDKLNLPNYKHLCVWLPTYRQSVQGDIRLDGSVTGDVFQSGFNFSLLNSLFQEKNCMCLIKPHPMAKANRELFETYSNIVFIDETNLIKADITLYQLLGRTDFLITDISSVYFDYKYTERPVVLFCPDLDEYKNSRGFVAPIENLIKEDIEKTDAQLVEKCHRIISNLSINQNNVPESNQTSTLFKKVGINYTLK